MTSPNPPDPKASPAAPPGSEEGRIKGLDERFGAIEAEQKNQRGMLEKVLGAVSGSAPAAPAAAQQVTADRLNAPGSVADEVRAELARQQAEQQAADKADADRSDLAQMKVDLAALKDTRPDPPMRKVTTLLWGRP